MSVIKKKEVVKKKKPTLRGNNDTNFALGDKAVYPAYGVGVIERIDEREIAGTMMSFYVLRILDSEMTLMVPVNGVKNVGLRRLIKGSQVGRVFDVFKENDVVIDTTTWNRRQREYNEKIKTGSVFEIAEVMRDLYVLKKGKTLSFGERSMMDKARTLLIKELALAKEVEEDVIEKKIEKFFEDPIIKD